MANPTAGRGEHSGESARPPRTAVIVIAGVGDNPSGSAAEALTSGLLRHGGRRFHHAERAQEDYAAARSWCGEDPEPSQSVVRHTLFDRGGHEVADVYEAWWADLSRFRGATRSALLATVGMLQQATTIGRAALRGGGPLCADPSDQPEGQTQHAPDRGFRVGATLLGIIEWLVAVPLVCIVAIHVALFAAADYAMVADGAHTRHDLAGLAVVSLLLVAALTAAGRWYSHRRPGVALVGLPLLAGTIAVAAWRATVHGNLADRGLLDAIFVLAVYPMRIVWMLIAALAVVAVAALGTGALRYHPRRAGRRISTAALSMFGPFGLALVGALIYAAAGATVQKLASQRTMSLNLPWCLPSLSSWGPQTCTPPPDHPFTAFDWGVSLFQTGVVPLMYVAALTLLTFAGAAVGVGVSVLVARVRGGGPLSLPVYLRTLFHLSPGAVAVALAPAAALVLLTYLPGGERVLVWQQLQQGQQGGGRFGSVAAVVAAASGWAIGALLAAARALKLGTTTLRNKGTIGDGVRVPLDLAYDIATYLRDPSRLDLRLKRGRAPRLARLARERSIVPRQRIIGRFSALLEHVDGMRRYDACLIVAHSQGTVLATALLNRPEGRLRIPGGRVSLVTMGSPLRRLYSQRLPLQFAWVDDLLDQPNGFVRSLNGLWINFGADGDLVGRTVFTDEPDGSLGGGGPVGDRVVPGRLDWNVGPGGHASYWTSGFVMEQIAALIADHPRPATGGGGGTSQGASLPAALAIDDNR
jgi:hypothetical protein